MIEREIKRISKYFSVLQNRNCLKIIFLLKEKAMYVYEIAERLESCPSVISIALRKLRLIDMIDYKQESKRRKYYLKRVDIFSFISGIGAVTERNEKVI